MERGCLSDDTDRRHRNYRLAIYVRSKQRPIQTTSIKSKCARTDATITDLCALVRKHKPPAACSLLGNRTACLMRSQNYGKDPARMTCWFPHVCFSKSPWTSMYTACDLACVFLSGWTTNMMLSRPFEITALEIWNVATWMKTSGNRKHFPTIVTSPPQVCVEWVPTAQGFSARCQYRTSKRVLVDTAHFTESLRFPFQRTHGWCSTELRLMLVSAS